MIRTRSRHALRPCRFTVAIRWIGLSLMASACLFPFYAMIVLSLKSGTVELPGSLWPFSDVSLDSYRQVLSGQNLPRWLLNTVIYSVTSVVIVLFVSALAGYAFAKKRFPGREVMFWTFLSMVMVPFQVTVIPTFMLISTWKGINTYWGMIVPTLANAQAVFLMRQFIHGLPDELFEAARVDGCSMLRTFWHVALPAARPAASMLALFTFVGSWTTFFWPFIILGADNPTLPVALQLLQATHFKDYSLIMSGVVISTIPLVLVFIVAGRQLVSGIMQGAVKG